MNKNISSSSQLSFPLFILLLILAVIKDGVEVLIGLIPGFDAFSWIFSLPFAAVIILIIFLIGISSTWFLIGQLIDALPFASILPVTTLSVIGVYIAEKSPHLRKAAKVAAKVMPPTKPTPSQITKKTTSFKQIPKSK